MNETADIKVGEIYERFDGLYAMDLVLGIFLTLCGLVGLLSNTASVLFFLPRLDKSIHDLLYLLISVMDLLTSIGAFPIVASLFIGRAPGIFANSGFCFVFGIAILFALRMSLFLVVIMSGVRTLVVIKPHYVISRRGLLISVLVYASWLLLVDLVFLAQGSLYMKYFFTVAACTLDFYPDKLSWAIYFWYGCLQVQLMLPPFLVFVSFAISAVSMLKRNTQQNRSDEKFKRATITIFFFTSLFLFCYIPCFLYQLAQLVHLIWPNSFSHNLIWEPQSTLYYTGRLWLQQLTVFLNPALNPCLYFLRMPRFRNWLLRLMRINSIKPDTSVTSKS